MNTKFAIKQMYAELQCTFCCFIQQFSLKPDIQVKEKRNMIGNYSIIYVNARSLTVANRAVQDCNLA